jgi:prophage regulatory protein
MSTEDHKERFLRLPEVQDRTGFSRSFIYKGVNDKTFPAPRKVGGRASVWLESEINDWMSHVAREQGAVE